MSVFDKNDEGKSKVDLAVARIKNFCTGRKALVAFSGGKDSQCCYHLAKEAGIPFDAIYSITRFEPPQLMHFIRANYPETIFRRAYKRSLVEEVTSAGLPSRWARWWAQASRWARRWAQASRWARAWARAGSLRSR